MLTEEIKNMSHRSSRVFKKTIGHFLALILLIPFMPAYATSVAMVLWRGQTDAELGFIEGLEELGYSVNITVFDADQDKRNLAKILRKDLAANIDEFDYVYSFGTTVTKAVQLQLKGTKPHVFNIVNNPVKSGILPSEQGGQHNTAGVSNRVLLQEQINSARAVIPLEDIVFLFNPREANSTQQLEKLVELGKVENFNVIPLRIRPDEDRYMSDLEKIREHQSISAVYLPADSFLISNSKPILDFINDENIPSVCAVSKFLKDGCTVGVVSDYYALGKLAASIVHQREEGKEFSEIPVQFDPAPVPSINTDKLESITSRFVSSEID